MACRTDRYSSGAPSIQPSLAPTYRSSTPATTTTSHRISTASTLAAPMSEKAPQPTTISPPRHDPKSIDLRSWSGALDRMHDSRLDRQRYVLSAHKSEEVSKLALGAKLERALSRRMVGQDASFTKAATAAAGQRPYDEKRYPVVPPAS